MFDFLKPRVGPTQTMASAPTPRVPSLPVDVVSLLRRRDVGALLELACADDDADACWLICFYAPLLRDDPLEVLKVLATHDDFFVREAAALGRIDVREAANLLKFLAADAHPQVAAEANRSIAARTRGDANLTLQPNTSMSYVWPSAALPCTMFDHADRHTRPFLEPSSSH